MNTLIQYISNHNNQLEQFKSSINALIKHNNDYVNSIKRYSNKNFEIEINGNGRNISEEKKNEIETMIDQLEDIKQRNELIIQTISEYENKMDEIRKNIKDMKE